MEAHAGVGHREEVVAGGGGEVAPLRDVRAGTAEDAHRGEGRLRERLRAPLGTGRCGEGVLEAGEPFQGAVGGASVDENGAVREALLCGEGGQEGVDAGALVAHGGDQADRAPGGGLRSWRRWWVAAHSAVVTLQAAVEVEEAGGDAFPGVAFRCEGAGGGGQGGAPAGVREEAGDRGGEVGGGIGDQGVAAGHGARAGGAQGGGHQGDARRHGFEGFEAHPAAHAQGDGLHPGLGAAAGQVIRRRGPR